MATPEYDSAELFKFGPRQCQPNDYIRANAMTFHVKRLEAFFLEYRNIVAGIDVGFNSGQLYRIEDLQPDTTHVYIIQRVAIFGTLRIRIQLPIGVPHFTVLRTEQYFGTELASLAAPLPLNFAMTRNDVVGIQTITAFAPDHSAVYFFGYLAEVEEVKENPKSIPLIVIKDVREYK